MLKDNICQKKSVTDPYYLWKEPPMRVLHAVASHEHFVAQGIYRVSRDGVERPSTEQFSVHRLDDAEEVAYLLRVDEDGRREDGLSILTEVLVSQAGNLERLNVRSSQQSDPNADFQVGYLVEGEQVSIDIHREDEHIHHEMQTLYRPSLPYIPQTLYMGMLVAAIAQGHDSSQVTRFDLYPTDDAPVSLQKMIVQKLPRSETIDSTTTYRIADDVTVTLNETGIVTQRRYRHDGADYVVSLHDFAVGKDFVLPSWQIFA